MKRCVCGIGGSRALHRMEIGRLTARRVELRGLRDVADVVALLDSAESKIVRCLADDTAIAKHASKLAVFG